MEIPEWSRKMDLEVSVRDTKPSEAEKASPTSPVASSQVEKAGSGEAARTTEGPKAETKTVEISARTGKPKRRKALRACGNCQRTHLTCDDNRPCERCVKRGCADTCADGVRKKVKYLDRGSREKATSRDSKINGTTLPPLYAAAVDGGYVASHRSSAPSLDADFPVQGLLDLSQHGQAPYLLSETDMRPHPPEQTGTQAHASALHTMHSHQDFSASHVGPPSHSIDSHRHLSDPALTSQMGAAVGPLPFQPLAEEPASGTTYTTAAAGAAIIAPSHEPNAFNSFAADSEYTVVARMLENSRAKSDEDYSPADTPKFASSNVDLRNFVTLQPSAQEPGPSPDEQGYGSWLDPPPPPPPAVVVQRRKSGVPNVRRVGSDGSDQSVGAALPHPSDVYRSVREPYPYTPAFHGLLTFLKQRFNREKLMRIVRSMARIRPSFIAVTKDLTHEDLIFMEQCFQRSLLEYEKYFAYSGTPSIVWRRTGQIAAVAPEFCMLTQWPRHELRSRFIVEVMSDESAVDYFERFSEMTFTDTRGQTMYDCSLLTPMGQQIRTSAVLTVRKDMFGIPMTIIGNFLPHV